MPLNLKIHHPPAPYETGSASVFQLTGPRLTASGTVDQIDVIVRAWMVKLGGGIVGGIREQLPRHWHYRFENLTPGTWILVVQVKDNVTGEVETKSVVVRRP